MMEFTTKRFQFFSTAVFVMALGVPNFAWASVDADPMQRDLDSLNLETVLSTSSSLSTLRDDQLYNRKWDVLNAFHVHEEDAFTQFVEMEQGQRSLADIYALEPFMNPRSELEKYMTWTDQKIQLFKDRGAKTLLDYEVSLRPNLSWLEKHAGSQQDKSRQNQSLQGKRVMLDPGHMGGEFWDKETGKFVSIGKDKVSEGELNLVTAHLVAERLRALGAEVKLSHETLGAVSDLDYRKYDILPYARDQLQKESDEAWFENLLTEGQNSSVLVKKFEAHSRVKKIFSEFYRGSYFILKADMQARTDTIAAFDPDITLFIHYDASDNYALQKSVNRVKVYVPGSVLEAELASRKGRYQYLSHLLNRDRWESSVRLSSEIAQGISKAAGIPLEYNPNRAGETKVKDGVYARNLALSKPLLKGAQAYLECLHYDYSEEFYRMAKKDRVLRLANGDLPYSSRTEAVADGITEGVKNYFAE